MDVEQVTGEQVCWGRWEEVPVSQPHRQENNVCECYISWSAALFIRKGSGFVCMVDSFTQLHQSGCGVVSFYTTTFKIHISYFKSHSSFSFFIILSG